MNSQLKTICEPLEFTRSGSENPEGHVITATCPRYREVRGQLGGCRWLWIKSDYNESVHAGLLCVVMVEMAVIVSIADRRSSNVVFLPTQKIR